MDLTDWHRRLHEHFRILCEQRGGWPLFALEHGLSSQEMEDLKGTVGASIARGAPTNAQRYAWVVYASEFGYRYSGESYWPAFEQETPGWLEHGGRTWLRTWLREAFQEFAAKFKGAEPHGPWAEHFSIICWPITHGVLPKDLQRQLVKLLFDFRTSFSSATFRSAETLGGHIHALSKYGSARFQEFAENELLLGQISAALLVKNVAASSLLLPDTLDRILDDINAERTAGEWLREAQTRVGRLNVRGLGSLRDRGSSRSAGKPSETRTRQVAALRLDAGILARAQGTDSWQVWLQLPSLAPLASIWPEVGAYLERVRPILGFNDHRPLARGRLLAGSQSVRLEQWPAPATTCLEFEEPPNELSLVIDGIRFPSSEPLVLRVNEDGEGTWVRSGAVRAGEQYLLLSRDPLDCSRPELQVVPVNCLGVSGLMLQMPKAISDGLKRWLAAHTIAVDRNVRVWPVGPAPALWDDNGYCECLVGEPLIIAVAADFAIAKVTASCDTGPPVTADMEDGESPLFLHIDPLGEGAHQVVFEAVSTLGEIAAGKLAIVSRVSGATGRSEHSAEGMLFSCVPRSPSLEAMWDGNIEVTLLGPSHYKVGCSLSLLGRNNTTALLERRLPPLALPVEARTWQDYWKAHVLADEALVEQYELASASRVTWDGGPIGRQSLTCERTVTPLRWAVTRANDRVRVRLLDDREGGAVAIEYYSFDRPADVRKLAIQRCLEGWDVLDLGGLLYANAQRWSAAVIVSPPLVARDLDKLEITCSVSPWNRQREAIGALFLLIDLWSRTEIRGSALGPPRRARAVACLVSEFFSTLDGGKWRRVEEDLNAGRRIPWGLVAKLIGPEATRQIDERAKANALGDMGVRVQALEAICRVRLATECLRVSRREIATIRPGVRRRVDQVRWLCEFVLRISTDPASVRDWAGPKLGMGLEMLLDVPALGRVGRLFALCGDRPLQ